MDHNVVGSDGWRNFEEQNLKHRLQQYGALCMKIAIEIPMSISTLASCFIQDGFTISVEYHGEPNQELTTEYYIHTEHKSDTDCVQKTCNKVNLKTFIQNEGIVLDRTNTSVISTYVGGSQQKLNSFVKNLLKSEISDLFSENFHLELKYCLDYSISIEGYIWPKLFDELNQCFSEYPNKTIGKDQTSKILKQIETRILATSDVDFLTEQCGLSKIEAMDMSKIVMDQQYHPCKHSKPCTRCKVPYPLSVTTCFIEFPGPEFMDNIEISKNFQKMILSEVNLVDYPNTDFDTQEWLKILSRKCQIEMTENVVSVKFKDKKYSFLIDDRLRDLMATFENIIVSLNQYSVSCAELCQSFSIVLKRDKIYECFIDPYEMITLKAFGSRVKILPVNGFTPNLYYDSTIDNSLRKGLKKYEIFHSFQKPNHHHPIMEKWTKNQF